MSAHLGHRENPVVVTAPGDLDRACSRVWQPTPEQAAAGNYKMAHAILGTWDLKGGDSGKRLHVTIETPLDRTRSGIDPNGKPWSVRMPAHYGYVKRTEGADGDHVDVYVGPEAHRVHALPVWVVDQCDANSKAFDEHKVMLGFPSGRSARETFHAAFSDGRGPDRTGAATRMTFDEFVQWLESGSTKKPLALKSASVLDAAAAYGPLTCRCAAPCGCNGTSGGFMTTETITKANVTGAALINDLVAKGLATLNPTQRAELLASSAISVTDALAKADAMTGDIPTVEDLWDGPNDDHAETTRAHGPGSEAKPGMVQVGPGQSASGNGAEKMEREYSRHAPQEGVQRATEKLGEAVMGMGKAMKSLVGAVRTQGMMIEALKSGVAVTEAPTTAAIQAMITEAVGKSMGALETRLAKSIRSAVAAKAGESDKEDDKESGEEDDEDDEEEDDEASESESGSGTDIEIVNENDEEGEDEADSDEGEKAKSITAARFRIMAKSRLKWASRRLAKADEAEKEKKPKTAEHMMKKARHNLRKARSYLDASAALRGKTGPSSKAIAKAISKAKAKLPVGAKMQDKWPESNAHEAGKAAPAEGEPTPAMKAFNEAAEKLAKAASGMGMLQTDIKGMFDAMMSRSVNGDGVRLPPAFAIAKSGGDDLTTKESEIMQMAETNVIDFDAADKARDVIGLMRARAVPELISAKAARLPPAVQAVLNRKAA